MFSAESHEDFFSSSSSCGSAPGAGICSGHISTRGRTGYKPLLQQHPAGTQGCCALAGDELLPMSCPLLLFASTIQSMHKNEASGEGTEPRELIALNAAHCKHLQQNPSSLPSRPALCFTQLPVCVQAPSTHQSPSPRFRRQLSPQGPRGLPEDRTQGAEPPDSAPPPAHLAGSYL